MASRFRSASGEGRKIAHVIVTWLQDSVWRLETLTGAEQDDMLWLCDDKLAMASRSLNLSTLYGK